MRSELQYFMLEDDHRKLDELILSIDGVQIKSGKYYDEIHLLDGFIQYERSKFEHGVLTAGRIAIATTDLNGEPNFSSHKEAEVLYKKLRSWIKKCSTNSLVAYNEKVEEPVCQPTTNFWVAPQALEHCKDSNIRLKQFFTTNVAFKLTQMP